MVAMLGHNVPRVFMLVFGVGTGLAAVAGVIAGPALVTQSNMAAALGPILFVVVVVGGLGSLAGAFVASLLIGLVQTFAVSVNLRSPTCSALRRRAPAARRAVRRVERDGGADRADHALSAAGADPDLAADRPDGNARHIERRREIRASAPARVPARRRAARCGGCGVWIAARSPVRVLPHVFSLRHRADDAEPDGHHDRVRALLQHAARPDRHALVRARGLLRARRLLRRARDERRHPRPAAGAAPADAARRRLRRPRVRHHLRLGVDAARRHRLRHDLARPRRARRLELAHPARLLRRRGRASPPTAPSCCASSGSISARRSRSII